MNLCTQHGRAQAIAEGGQAGELARLVEEALDHHSSETEERALDVLEDLELEFFDWQELTASIDHRVECVLESDEFGQRAAREALDKQVAELDGKIRYLGQQVRIAKKILSGTDKYDKV